MFSSFHLAKIQSEERVTDEQRRAGSRSSDEPEQRRAGLELETGFAKNGLNGGGDEAGGFAITIRLEEMKLEPEMKQQMSWARLCSLLGELGYEGHRALDPDNFHWPFQYEDARPILDWLCSSLFPPTVLLQPLKQMPWSYRDNLVIYILQSKYDMLSTQASALIQGKRARVTSTSIVNGQLTTIDDSLSARNLEMNAVLGKIASTTQELAHFHSGNGFHPYLLLDALCMKELNQWFVKQLDTISGFLPVGGRKGKIQMFMVKNTNQQAILLALKESMWNWLESFQIYIENKTSYYPRLFLIYVGNWLNYKRHTFYKKACN
ncbi:hypothetical protein LXL04_033718 [Taraxacum kok-saghyz]